MTQAVAQVRNVVDRTGFANPLTLGVLVTTASYVKVYADTTLLDSGTDYEITGIGETGGVSIEIIGAEDVDNYVGVETFTALFDPPLDQQGDLSAGGVLGRAFESALDQQNRRLQAQADRVTRSIKLPVNVDGDIVLPAPVDEAYLTWDADTEAFVWAALGGPTAQPLDADLSAIAALTTTSFGRSLLALSAAEDARGALDMAPYVATRTALKALDTTKDTVAILTEAGREGVFVWTTGNYTARAAVDTAEGCTVKATAIALTAGAWLRADSVDLTPYMFGAVGDGATDDYAALQAYASFCGYSGAPFRLTDSAESYAISAKIVFKVTRDLDAVDVTPASDLHFSDNLPFVIEGSGNAKIVATAPMASMFELIFDTGDSDIGPFYTVVSGIHFDGGGLATSGIKSDYTMHVTYENNRFDRLTRGIEYVGYGSFRARNNVLRCKYGFYLVGGGGDSLIESNDFYSASNTTAGIYLGYYGGNLSISGNVFTNSEGYTGAYGIQAVGSTAATSEEIRHNAISDNEFCGLTAGIKADGKATGTRNIWDWKISGNHTTSYGASNPGTLLQAVDCTDFILANNQINGVRLGDTTGKGLDLTRCERFIVEANLFGAVGDNAIAMVDCIDCVIYGNRFDDTGKTSSSLAIIDISGSASTRNFISGNQARQSSASYAQTGVKEGAGVTATAAPVNLFTTVGTPYDFVGTTSFGWYSVGTQMIAQADGTGISIAEQTFNTTATAGANFFLRRGRGSAASPAAVLSGDRLGSMAYAGQYDTTAGNFGTSVVLIGEAAENFAAGARGADLAVETVPIGSATRRETHRFKSTGALKYVGVTVANLPTGAAGDTMFATNGRKNGEGAGTGTGVLVFHDGTAWRACDTGATVAA